MSRVVMTMALTCSVLICSAGKLEKGFEALAIKDYFKAFSYFEKALFKAPAGGAYGLSLIYAEEKNPYFQLDSAMKYIHYADSAYLSASPKKQEYLAGLDIDRKTFSDHKLYIAEVAFLQLKDYYTISILEDYMRAYPFSARHREVMQKRDEIAFEGAKEENTHKAYRQFIIDYPASAQREQADSLYALKFFEEQTANGDVESLKNFVKEFSSNPHTEEAMELIYQDVRKSNSVDEYYDHIRSFPNSPYVQDAWRQINDIYMMEFTKERLTKLLWDFPDNRLKEEARMELETMFAPRFPVLENGSWQLIDREGRFVTSEGYDMIGDYSENLVSVARDGKTAYVDKQGRERTPLIYDDALPFSGGFGVVEKDGKYGAVDRHGNVVIPFEYEELGQFQYALVPASKGEGFIYIDGSGDLAISELYEEASDFKDGYAVVKLDGRYGLIDVTGEFQIPAIYDWVEPFDEGVARVKNDGLFGLYRYQVGEVVPPTYEHLTTVSDERRIIVLEDEFGYMDPEGNVIIAPQFGYGPETLKRSMFQLGHAVIKEKGRYGVIDAQGQFVIPAMYDDLGRIKSSILTYQKNGKYGLLDFNNTVQPAVYEYADDFKQGAVAVRKDDRMGLIDAQGDLLIEAVYDTLYTVQDTEFAIFERDSLKGVVHREDGELLFGQFDALDILYLRYARMRIGERLLYFDLDEGIDVWSMTTQR